MEPVSLLRTLFGNRLDKDQLISNVYHAISTPDCMGRLGKSHKSGAVERWKMLSAGTSSLPSCTLELEL